MDDDRLAREYLDFVKAVNSDWTIPDKEDDIGVDDAFTGAYKGDRRHTPHEKNSRRNAAKAAIAGGRFNARRKR